MNYLILGGAGFIGQHLARRLNNDGHQVTIVDDLSSSRSPNIEGVRFVKSNASHLSHHLNVSIYEADVVYFLAGSVGVDYVDKNPARAIRNNVDLMSTLMPVFETRNKRVIFASTSEVYGNGPFVEDAMCHIGPTSELRWGYAASKLMTEFMLASSRIPYTVLRYFNVAGPGQLPDYGMVLPRFVKAAKEGSPLRVYGDGSSVRSFCHVADAVEYMVRLEPHTRDTFNIGTSHCIDILGLAEKVIQIAGSASTIEFVPYEEEFSTFKRDVVSRVPDITKLVKTTGYEPQHDIDSIIRSML